MQPTRRDPLARGCVVLLAGLLLATRGYSSDPAAPTGRVVRVRVEPGGSLFLDGERMPFDTLTDRLEIHAARGDVVAFSGDISDTNAAGAVFERVVRAGLPVVMRSADGSPRDEESTSLRDIRFQQLPVSEVLNYYAGVTGSRLLSTAGLDVRVTLSVQDATDGEAVKAVEVGLSRYGIAVSRTDDGEVNVKWTKDW